jgi:hypothetical protein
MTLPHARTNPPWSSTAHTTDGVLWSRPGARNSTMLTFDEAGRHHAATTFGPVGATYELHGRLFDVRAATGPVII